MTDDTVWSVPFRGRVSRRRIVDRIDAHPLGDTASEQRSNFERLVLGETEPETHGRRDDADRHDVHFVGDGATIVYFHGGGYAFGSPGTHERIASGLHDRTGLGVIVPRYPRAPEHPWPAQLDSALASIDAVRGPVVLAGDSAGGHLALVATLAAARRGREVAGLVLFSPNTDRSGLSDTRTRNDPLDPMVDDLGDRELARQCFGDMSRHHPHVSPVLDDLSLLPPTHVEVGVDEVLAGDSRVLADRAHAAGAHLTIHEEPEGLHMGQLWAPWWPTAVASLDRAADFTRSVVSSR